MKMNIQILALGAAMLAGTMLSGSVFAADRPDIIVAVQSGGNKGSLDTSDNDGTAARKFQNSIYEELILMDLSDPNLSPKPGLATEWHWDNPKELVVKLREGVKFHNGDVMSADDVVFSFSDERFGLLPEQVAAREAGQDTYTRKDGSKGIVPSATSAAARLSEWPLLDHVEKIDDLTVKFVMKQPNLDTEARLSRVNYAAILSARAFHEAKSWRDFALHPVATGPYKVENVEPGSAIHLVSNDDYWGGLPPIHKLDIMIVPEAASRINGLLSGEYDIISDVGPDQVPAIEKADGYSVVGGPVANVRFINFDTNHGPLKNKKVRQALTHLVDHNTLVNVLWNGLTKPTNGFQHPLFGDLYIDEFKEPAFDPELAKKLLAEAGYKGEPITYKAMNDYYPNELTIAQYNLEVMKNAGVNIDFKVMDNANDPADDRMMSDLSNTAYFAFPAAIIANFCPNGSMNKKSFPSKGTWQNDEFDELCGVISSSTDKDEVRKSFARALQILEVEDPAMVTVHQNAILYGKRDGIEWKSSAMFAMDFTPGAIKFSK